MTPEFIVQLLGVGSVAAGLYAAIRADLVRALVTAQHAAAEAAEAHKRIDVMLGERRRHA